MRSKTMKNRIGFDLLRLSLILLFIIMISVYLMSGVMAKFTVTASAGDGARVALFNVRAVLQTEGVDVKADNGTDTTFGSAAYYEFTVSPGGTEVLTKYHVSITLTDENGITGWPVGSVPDGEGGLVADQPLVTAVLTNADGSTELDVSGNGEFENFEGTFLPGATENVTYRIYLKSGYTAIGGTYQMNISVIAEQVD